MGAQIYVNDSELEGLAEVIDYATTEAIRNGNEAVQRMGPSLTVVEELFKKVEKYNNRRKDE